CLSCCRVLCHAPSLPTRRSSDLYRQDSWVVYYNKEMFAAAGIDEPDGSWTWDDFADLAEELTSALAGTDYRAKGAYMHNWQSIVDRKSTRLNSSHVSSSYAVFCL